MLKDMPWYDYYLMILEGRERAKDELTVINTPKQKADSIRKFYESIGADYEKNRILVEHDKDLSDSIEEDSEEAKQYKEDIHVADVLEKALNTMDEDSFQAVVRYRYNPKYSDLINQVLFYLGIRKVETDPYYITKAYNALLNRFNMQNIAEFIDNGARYYIQYWESVEVCVKKHSQSGNLAEIQQSIKERLFNFKLILQQYSRIDIYASFIKTVREHIDEIEKYL